MHNRTQEGPTGTGPVAWSRDQPAYGTGLTVTRPGDPFRSWTTAQVEQG